MSTRLLIVGAGGHAKVVAETAQLAGFEVVGFLDRSAETHDQSVLGLPVLGDERLLGSSEYAECAVVVAVGDNAAREAAVARLTAQGVEFALVVHPAATVSESARLGAGTVVFAGAVVNSSAAIGAHCIINTLACIEHDTVLGDFAHVSPGANLGGGCRAGRLAHIGIGASVLPHVSIGSRATIGGGAAVISDIPDDAVAVGVPATVVKERV